MRSFALVAGVLCLSGLCSAQVKIEVKNDSDQAFREAPMVVPWTKAEAPNYMRGEQGGGPVQADDINGDGKPDELVFLVSIGPHQAKTVTLTRGAVPDNITSRASTGMFLPTKATKGFEGPGWESDRICFRLYWDARNATDIFCKTEPIMSMEAYASKGLDYHVQSKWGQDVLKVGTAVGIGGVAIWDNGKVQKVAQANRTFKVVANGPVRAMCDLIYTDWVTSSGKKYDLTSRMSIIAGQTWAQNDMALKAKDGGELPEFVAGIVKHPETTLIEDKTLGILGTWGKQALGNNQVPKSNNLGMGVIVDPQSVDTFGDDGIQYYAKLKSDGGKTSFRYTAEWEKTPGAAKSSDEYRKHLEEQVALKKISARIVDKAEETK